MSARATTLDSATPLATWARFPEDDVVLVPARRARSAVHGIGSSSVQSTLKVALSS